MWLKILIVLSCTTIGLGAAYITKKKDGPIEQVAEAIIEDHTGLEVDLTP